MKEVAEKDWTKDQWAQGGPGPVWRPEFLAGESEKTISKFSFGSIHFVGQRRLRVGGYVWIELSNQVCGEVRRLWRLLTRHTAQVLDSKLY